MQDSTWRLILDAPADGPRNMAVDEAILEAVGQERVPPTLRLYRWDPPCLSLGYSQSAKDINLGALSREGWGIVRRPTGGRAILHTDELTYAVIAPLTEPRVTGSVLESYRRLSQALLDALHRLDLPAVAQEEYSSQSSTSEPVCFEHPSNYEITVNGKKLVGSAQARQRWGVLQHGTLPLVGDLSRITRVLCYAEDAHRQKAAERLFQRATTVETVLHQQISWEQASAAFIEAFAHTLHIHFQIGRLTDPENQRAIQWVEEKYGHPSWTFRM
jgi:lipoyl(octanoyl) transferase